MSKRPSTAAAEGRNENRRDCSVLASITVDGTERPCVVSNVSSTGMGITLLDGSDLELGDKIKVSAKEFSSVVGSVRWEAHPRYGITLLLGAGTADRYQSFVASLHPEALLRERLTYLGIDDQARNRVRSLAPLVDRYLPLCLDNFYEVVKHNPSVNSFFASPVQLQSAKASQLRHWAEIVSGRFDDSYYTHVRRIGKTHARIGLEPRWYIGGYALIAADMARQILATYWPRKLLGAPAAVSLAEAQGALEAFLKVVFLDMDLSISVYLDETAQARLEGEAHAIEGERRAVIDSVGAAMQKLAQKELTYRIRDDVPDAYAMLKSNYNLALDQIETALATVATTSDGVVTGAREISRAAEDLSRQTENQAASLEETVAALNEITSTVTRSAKTVSDAQTIVSQARQDAQRSGEVVRKAIGAMTRIEQSSAQIANIIGVIDEIAFQTNLLALNAGVEAARAGESGRGFAVVASEVRALAQRSAEAAKEIKGLISESAAQVTEGVSLVGESGVVLEAIIGKVVEINDLMSGIARDAREQSTGLHEISTAMNQMDQATQRNAAMAEETTAVSQTLTQDAQDLSGLMDQFSTSGAKTAQVGRIARSA